MRPLQGLTLEHHGEVVAKTRHRIAAPHNWTTRRFDRLDATGSSGYRDAQQNGFRAPLDHLNRLGVPREPPRTRFKNGDFEDQVWEWAICLDLAEFATDPATIVEFRKIGGLAFWRSSTKSNETDSTSGADEAFVVAAPRISASWSGDKKIPYRWIRNNRSRELFRTRCANVINIAALYQQIDQASTRLQSPTIRRN